MKAKVLIFSSVIVVAGSLAAAEVKENWKKHCATCHGADGKGDTKMGKKLDVKDYTDPKVQAAMKDEDMIQITKEGKKEGGKTKMNGFKDKLSDDEIKALVAHIRSFKK
jgi:cytochrome c553